ncbi:hypothetical protein [Candidatus Erwinia haradaeae]|nr:hypothetical protein [Candidatus Erwinia haradaeae]
MSKDVDVAYRFLAEL